MTDADVHPDEAVVDLGAVGRACAAVVSWYDDPVAGLDPSIARLDGALVELAALPPVGGRLGRAIGLIARGGATDSDATIAALELLRHASTCSAMPSVPSPVSVRRPARRAARHDVPLPGLGPEVGEADTPRRAEARGARP
jgi:hypothetical protein